MIVIVGGMHRSGTSAMAGVLHDNGIIMGEHENKDFYPPPMRENPKGFYENVRFRRLNDAMLKQHNYSVKSFDPIVPRGIVADIQQRSAMRKLITHYLRYDHWGWKDPRTSLTINSWLSVLAEMRLIKEVFIINMLRAPIDVADSMKVRGNREKTPGQFEAVTCAYQNTLMAAMKTWRHEIGGYMEVFFNQMIFDPDKTLMAISSTIGKEVANNGFIDPDVAKNTDGDTVRTESHASAVV